MTRLVRRNIEVRNWSGDEPASFQDGEVVYRVSDVIDSWMEMGDWWNGEGARKVVRVLTEEQALLDLECEKGQWSIYRVWD